MERITFNIGGSKVRHDSMEGRDYLVAPMVMLTEGVHAGSNGALLYPGKELGKTPVVWNYKPIVLYHPSLHGNAISACDPDVLTNRKVGVIMRADYADADGKLKAEAWIDPVKADAVDERIRERLESGEPMEVSTGLFTDNEPTGGEWNGEFYTAIARNYRPDHLALLPDMKGACSIADGAGLLMNQESVTPREQAIRRIEAVSKPVENEKSADELRDALQALVSKGVGVGVDYTWVVDVWPDHFVYERDGKTFQQSYTKQKGDKTVLVGLAVEVERVVSYEPITNALGGNEMEKKELVDGLISNEATAWAEGDREALMAMDDAVLGKMAPIVNDVKPVVPEPENVEVKVEDPVQPKPTDNTPSQTVAEYVANAPEGMRDVLLSGLAAHRAEKAALIAMIVANKANKFTQEALAMKGIDDLKATAALAKAPDAKPGAQYGGLGDVDITANEEEALMLPQMTF